MSCCVLHNFYLFEVGDDGHDVGVDENTEVDAVVNHENEPGGVSKRDIICKSLKYVQ